MAQTHCYSTPQQRGAPSRRTLTGRPLVCARVLTSTPACHCCTHPGCHGPSLSHHHKTLFFLLYHTNLNVQTSCSWPTNWNSLIGDALPCCWNSIWQFDPDGVVSVLAYGKLDCLYSKTLCFKHPLPCSSASARNLSLAYQPEIWNASAPFFVENILLQTQCWRL